MMSAVKAVLRFLDRNFEQIACGICLCAMASCVFLQIILRYAFSAAAPWAEEIAVYSMIGTAYFGACLAVRDRAHIRIGLLYDALPFKWRLAMIIFADFMWLLFLCLALWYSVVLVRFLFDTVHVSPGLGIEQRWPQSIVPLCFLLMIVRMIQVYWRWFKNSDEDLPI